MNEATSALRVHAELTKSANDSDTDSENFVWSSKILGISKPDFSPTTVWSRDSFGNKSFRANKLSSSLYSLSTSGGDLLVPGTGIDSIFFDKTLLCSKNLESKSDNIAVVLLLMSISALFFGASLAFDEDLRFAGAFFFKFLPEPFPGPLFSPRLRREPKGFTLAVGLEALLLASFSKPEKL